MLNFSGMSSRRHARSGRRRGPTETRAAIASAARARFASLGYDRTTIRGVAGQAGVDPALVMHFFGSKQELFVAAMDLPFDVEDVMPKVLAGPRDEVGARVARFAVGLLEDPEARGVLTAIVRAAASEPDAARLVRDAVATRMVAAIAEGLGGADAELRASLVGSQIIGLVMARHVIAVEPLASLGPDALVAALSPNLQRYLQAPLSG